MDEYVAAQGCYPLTERRGSARYDFSGDIEIVWGSKKIRGRTKNISRSGMFIEVPDGPDLGSVFVATLVLQTPLRVECRVRRVVSGHGVGISIVLVDKEAQARYEALLAGLELGASSAAVVEHPSDDEAERPFGRFRWVSQEAAPEGHP